MKQQAPSRPIIGVGVVVLRGDTVLLVKRGKAPKAQEWSLPGGKQELGETLRAAAIREVKEETGLDIDPAGLLDVIDFIDRDNAGTISFHYSLIDFWAESQSGLAVAGDDAIDIAWFTRADMRALPLWSETKRVIERAFDVRDLP